MVVESAGVVVIHAGRIPIIAKENVMPPLFEGRDSIILSAPVLVACAPVLVACAPVLVACAPVPLWIRTLILVIFHIVLILDTFFHYRYQRNP